MSISSVTNPASGSGTVMSWAPKRTDTASGPRCTCAVVMTAIGRQLLAVAEQEGAGDPVGELDGVVVQQPGDQRPAVLGAGGWSGRSAEAWHHQGGTVAVVGSPVEEVPHRVAGGSGGEPVVDVGLSALGQRDTPVVEPGEEADGGPQPGAGITGGGSRLVLRAGPTAQPAQDPPGGVGVQQSAMLGRLDVGEQRGDPGLHPGHGFVPGRQHPAGDQDVAQVVGGAARRMRVERLVRGREPASGEVGQQGCAGPGPQPVQRGARRPRGDDGLVDRHQCGRNLPTTGSQQRTGAAPQRAALAPAALVELVLHPAVDAHVAGRQPGTVGAGGRGRAGRRDQPAQRVTRVARTAATQCRGVAGVTDRPVGPVRGRWPGLTAAGAAHGAPRRAGCADRPVGAGETARPAPTPRRSRSRAATGLVTPQRAHGSASSRRRQRAHTPPATDLVNGRSVRRQCTQLGSGSEPAPRATSSVTSRPTTGGAPVLRAAGSAARAAANARSTAGLVTTTCSAVSICDADSAGSAASTPATTWRWQAAPLTAAATGPPGLGAAGPAGPSPTRRGAPPPTYRRAARSARPASSRGCRTTPPGWSD